MLKTTKELSRNDAKKKQAVADASTCISLTDSWSLCLQLQVTVLNQSWFCLHFDLWIFLHLKSQQPSAFFLFPIVSKPHAGAGSTTSRPNKPTGRQVLTLKWWIVLGKHCFICCETRFCFNKIRLPKNKVGVLSSCILGFGGGSNEADLKLMTTAISPISSWVAFLNFGSPISICAKVLQSF